MKRAPKKIRWSERRLSLNFDFDNFSERILGLLVLGTVSSRNLNPCPPSRGIGDEEGFAEETTKRSRLHVIETKGEILRNRGYWSRRQDRAIEEYFEKKVVLSNNNEE